MLSTVSFLGRFNVSARERQRHVILSEHRSCPVLAGVTRGCSHAGRALAEATSAAQPNPVPMHSQFMPSLSLGTFTFHSPVLRMATPSTYE
jgi:hypothetical protein